MKVTELRRSILQAAVQGRLVSQSLDDEPAEVLLKRIKQKKARFVRDGKTKEEKLLPITSENAPPFYLPENWIWCRLAEICSTITDGDHQAPPKETSGIPFLVISNISKGYFDFSNTRFVPRTTTHPCLPKKLQPKAISSLL